MPIASLNEAVQHYKLEDFAAFDPGCAAYGGQIKVHVTKRRILLMKRDKSTEKNR